MTDGMGSQASALEGDVREREVVLGKERFTVRPIAVGRCQGFVERGGPAVEELFLAPAARSFGDWLDLLGRHAEPMAGALAYAMGEAKDRLLDLPLSDFVALLAAWMELQTDFFRQQGRPAAGRLLLVLLRTAQDGSPESSTSRRSH